MKTAEKIGHRIRSLVQSIGHLIRHRQQPWPSTWPQHSPERRQFSVLCHRGWCNPVFRDHDIATMLERLTGKPGRPVRKHRRRRPVRVCHMPYTCECECHDGIKAAASSRPTAHAAAVYSRRSGFSADHAVLDQPLTAGRLNRAAGEALCQASLTLHGPSFAGSGKVTCDECLARARRYGVLVP